MIHDGSIWFMQSPALGSKFVSFASQDLIVSVSMTDLEVYDLIAMKHYGIEFSEAQGDVHVGTVSDIVADGGVYGPKKDTSVFMANHDKERVSLLLQKAMRARIDPLPEHYQKIWDQGVSIAQSLIIQKSGKKHN